MNTAAAPAFDDGLTVVHTGASLPSAPHIAMTVTMLRQAGSTPAVLTRPGVGFSPTSWLKPAGTRPHPAVSVPNAKAAWPHATATAEPELEPPLMRVASNALAGRP